MAKIHIVCPGCGQSFECGEKHRGNKIKCALCKQVILVPQISPVHVVRKPRRIYLKILLAAGVLVAAIALVALWIFQPVVIHWPDRRPIGTMFLASSSAASPTNPRGWFNDPSLNFIGTNGPERFRKALLEYTDRSIEILKRTGAQGVIVWDLEGEQYPHKITFVGDPRLLNRLAPEMSLVADEFFKRLREAGFKVGLTIRPQQLIFDHGWPQQIQVANIKEILLNKIDFARQHWGATLFYLDSNGSLRRPDELWQLRRLAQERPDILLIPEHSYLPYFSFSAPYNAFRKTNSPVPAKWARKLYSGSFQVMDIDDASNEANQIIAAWNRGDVLLFRTWFWSPECALLEGFAKEKK